MYVCSRAPTTPACHLYDHALFELCIACCVRSESYCRAGARRPRMRRSACRTVCRMSYWRFPADHCCGDANCQLALPGSEGYDGGVLGYCNVAASEADLMAVLDVQPVGVGLAISAAWLKSYVGGSVARDCGAEAGARLNEAALLVGYGQTAAGEAYWKVQLSRSSAFGDGGYALLARGRAAPQSLGSCGILAAASYPVVTKPQKPTPFPQPVPRKHYGDPPCLPGEVEQHIAGFAGTLCTSHCNATSGNPPCPPDSTRPDGSTSPVCALQNPATGLEYCALLCASDCDCPTGQACAMVTSTSGVCLAPVRCLSPALESPAALVLLRQHCCR